MVSAKITKSSRDEAGKNRGRKLISIIHPRTETVYYPHVYDIPWRPYKVLCFALRMVLTMIDRGFIKEDFLKGRAGLYEFRTIVRDVLYKVQDYLSETGDPISYQGGHFA